MKIDKVLFSTSVEYSDFWNIISKVYKVKLGIEPVCLLFGKKENTNVTEEFGKVIEMPILPQYNRLLQVTWSKFYYPIFEPDTTWMIGDIDMIPLQTQWFTENIKDIPDDHYAHLNTGSCCQGASRDLHDWWHVGGTVDGGCDLPGQYHTAKGYTFKKALEHTCSFEEELQYIINSKRYGLGARGSPDPKWHNPEVYYWCAEEHRSTELIRKNIKNNTIKFYGTIYNTHNNTQRVDRGAYDYKLNDYFYDKDKLAKNEFVDVHCMRPYSKFETQTNNLLKIANMI